MIGSRPECSPKEYSTMVNSGGGVLIGSKTSFSGMKKQSVQGCIYSVFAIIKTPPPRKQPSSKQLRSQIH